MIFIMIAMVVFIADMIVKTVVNENEMNILPKSLFRGHILIEKTKNAGLCFSTLEKEPDKVRKITTTAMIIALALAIPIVCTGKVAVIKKIGAALIIGGAASNTLDRYIHGYVVDYIRIAHRKRKSNYVFNLSDVFITIGAAITVISLLRK